MSNPLRRELDALASTFAMGIVQAIRSASLADILEAGGDGASVRRGPGRPKGSTNKKARDESATRRGRGRPPRTDTGEGVLAIITYLRSHPGATGEAARKDLGCLMHLWNARVTRGIADGKIRKEGRLRSTQYWAQ